MKLEIQIANVVATVEGCFFVAVQMDYKDSHTPSQKLRTDLTALSTRPKFKRNIFTFTTLIQEQTLKFGLMSCPDSSESSISNCTPIGIGSMRISLSRLKQLGPEGESKLMYFLNKKKEVGQFQCIIRFISKQSKQTLRESKSSLAATAVQFNPLISRVLFSDEGSKDQLKMQNNIKQLQRQAQILYATFKSLKNQEEALQKLYSGLLKDQQELKNEIEMNQKINQKISLKITQRESLQALKLQIEMLKNSEEGKGLLLEKLEYFEERINIENQEHQRLADKYEKIKHLINIRIERAENYAQKLKGKQLQQFELQRNREILNKFGDIQYEFKCNQHIIEQLVTKTKKSELTADQAALILSQVNFKLKMQEVSGEFEQQDSILKLIQKEAGGMRKGQDKQVSEQEKLVLGIKLNALQQQILSVRSKIKQALGRKNFQESIVKRV